MSDNSGALVGDGWTTSDQSALDQSMFYPADMSGLPTSTPNAAKLRRKSRKSWFEITPKGFKFEIATEEPVAKKPRSKSDTVEVLTLTHFSGAPRLGFGTLKLGQEKTCTLLLRNPHDYGQSVKVEKVPEKKHFSVSCKEFVVGPEESYPLEITWVPTEAGGCREMVMMLVDGAYRVQAYVFGTVTAPPPQKKKGKRVGLLASKAVGPFSVIHTTSLANINHQYSPEKKTAMQSTKPSKAGLTQPKGPTLHKQTRVVNHGKGPTKGRKSNEVSRKSARLSGKLKPILNGDRQITRVSNENLDPVGVISELVITSQKMQARKSSEMIMSLPKRENEENIPRKKMRRSDTYSNVSGPGLMVPIIHGDIVKGLKDTSLLHIEDCEISFDEVVAKPLGKTRNINRPQSIPIKTSNLEPSFLESDDGSFVQHTRNVQAQSTLESCSPENEGNTLLKSKPHYDTLEPSFLEPDPTHTCITKSSVLTALQNIETYHDSLEGENQSIEAPSFLFSEDEKLSKPRSHRKRSGVNVIESGDRPTGVKLLRNAKRNTAQVVVDPETFEKDIVPKRDVSLADEHRPLNDSVGQSTLLEQLKSLRSFVHDKSAEIERCEGESFLKEGEDLVKEIQSRDTCAKRHTSPKFSMPGNVINIRRGTFVTDSTKLKLIETQKPSEASPRRTTFTVIKGGNIKPVTSKLNDVAMAINEEDEADSESGNDKEESVRVLTEAQHVQENSVCEISAAVQKESDRLYSADSLEDESFDNQEGTPQQIFNERNEDFTRRATLTVTKSRPSDALLEHAQRSAAALVCRLNASPVRHVTIPEDIVEKDAPAAYSINISQSVQKWSKNSTFEIPSGNNTAITKESSFPTTPYHLLPTSPHVDHSRRSTHVVKNPSIINLSRVNPKQLLAGFDSENEVEFDQENNYELEDEEVKVLCVSKDEKRITNPCDVNEEEIVDSINGPSLNTRRRKLSARRSVTSLGRRSVEHMKALQNEEVVETLKQKDIPIGETVDGVDDKAQTDTAGQLLFVPLDNVSVKRETKRPNPRQFLKKRSNPVTQDEDKRCKRVRSDRSDIARGRQQAADFVRGRQAPDVTKVKEPEVDKQQERTTLVTQSKALPARVTRQTARNVVTSRDVSITQGLKPKTSVVKGLAQSKLILSKKSKSAIPKHPLAFAAKNMFYDERWMEKQERGFVNWLNFILTPPEEHQGSDVKVKVDAGKLTIDVEKGRNNLAPTNEILSFRTYSAHRKLNRLRKSACRLFQSDSMRRVIQKLEGEVESNRLLVRKDKMLHADLGAKQKILDLLLSYNPLWLRIGLETIYGEVVPLTSNTDVYGLSRFVIMRVLVNPDIANEYAHPTVPNLYRGGYAEATAQHTLKKFLMLVYFLDQAKQQRLIDHNPCLFCKNSDIKISKDLLLNFSRDFLSGEGDISRHLGYLGYKVTYAQSALDEFDFAVKTLSTDLRDGLRLTRVMEIICSKTDLSKTLRVPAISRLQKVHNVEVVFKTLVQQNIETGTVTTRDIVDGHRERTLTLLWMIILHYQVAMVINMDQIREEVQILERSLRLKEQLHRLVNFECDAVSRRESEGPDLHTQDKRLNLLMKWCRAVCAFYDIKIENFTVSFSDGRALCHILHYYHPGLLPLSQIHTQTTMTHMESLERNCQQNINCSMNDSVNSSAIFGDVEDPAVYEQLLSNEKENFKRLSEKVKELGGVPLMLRWSDMSNTIPDEKVVVTYLMYLCARLLDIRHESRAARVIQHAWRAYRLRKIQAEYKVKIKAVVVIQRAVQKFLLRRREERHQSAALCVQRVWRGHRARSEARRLRLEQALQRQIQAVILVQRAVKRYTYRRKYLHMKAGISQLQAYCRGFLLRRKLHSAATTIQCVYRGHVVRRQFKHMKTAAVVIQAGVRSFLVRKECRNRTEAAQKIQRRLRAHLEMKREKCVYQTMRISCITIQNHWRRHLILKHEKQALAATKIQACLKGYLSRKCYRKLREKTICVQAAIRGHLQRRKFGNCKKAVLLIQRRFRDYLVARQQRARFLRIREAVIFMQAQRRMITQRKQYLLLTESATRLQASARMFVQRRKFQKMRLSAAIIQKYCRAMLVGGACRKDFLLSKGAAITIQAAFRGCMVRKEMVKCVSAVTVIQSVVRCYFARRRFIALKAAAVVCQHKYRAKTSGQKQREHFMKLKGIAIVLQNVFRGQRCRKTYVRDRNNIIKTQSIVRMFLCRRRYKKVRQAVSTVQTRYRAKQLGESCRRQYLITVGATITLQACIRGLVCRRQYRESRKRIIHLQAAIKGHLQYNRYQKLKKSTLQIQRRLRETLVARQRRAEFIRMKQAAVVVQSAWRMTQTRNQYVHMIHSAVVIQSVVRQWMHRNRYRKLKSATLAIEKYYSAKVKGENCRRQFLVSKGAAIGLQAAYRGHKVRKALTERQQASVKIQAMYKGFVQRNKYRQVKSAALTFEKYYCAKVKGESCRRQFLVSKGAAITLQAGYRGYKVRKAMKHRQVVAVRIQAVYRGFVQRNRYQKLKSAALTIEKFYCAKVKGEGCRRNFLVTKGAAITLQAAYRGHKVRKAMEEMRQAAVTIQAVYKGFVQRNRYQKLKSAALTIEKFYCATVKGESCRRQFLKSKGAAITLQAAYRGHKVRNAMKDRQLAAVKIQAAYRGFVQRNKYQKLKSAVQTIEKYYCAKVKGENCRRQFLVSKGAVISLQAAYRGHKVRKAMKERRQVAIKIQAAYRGFVKHKQFHQLKDATIRCQRKFRANMLTRKLQRQYVQVRNAVVTVQAAFRGYIQCRRYLLMRTSAVRIQAVVRGYLQRQRYQNILKSVITIQRRVRETLLSRQHRHDFLKLKYAVIVTQSAWRMRWERKRFTIAKEAAILIQTRYRGFVQQKNYQRLKSASQMIQKHFRAKMAGESCRRQFLICKGAVITIQAWYRGHVVRKEIKGLKKSAVLVQSVFRGFSQRRLFVEKKHAAVVCQRHYRAKVIARKLKGEFESSKKSVIHLQTVFRGWICRREFLKMKSAAIKIQTVCRMYINRSVFQQQRRAAVAIQQWYRGVVLTRAARHRFLILRGAAITIQAKVKMYIKHKRYLQTLASRRYTAAVKIQSMVKRYLERRRFSTLRTAAVTCQRRYRASCRGQQERRNYVELKKSTVTIQAHFRRLQCQRSFQKYQLSVVTIQAWFRGILVRRVYARWQMAARSLQTRWRAELLCRQHVMQYHELRDTAITIQSMYRGKVARDGLKRLKAAITIQSNCRMMIQQREYCRVRRSTVIIQSGIRGWQVRRQMAALRRQERQHRAAMKIQSVFRSWRAKKLLSDLRIQRQEQNAAVRIQSVVRVWQAKRLLADLKEQMVVRRQQCLARFSRVVRVTMAAMAIQRCYRNHRMMLVARERLQCILVIQRWTRSRLQRMHYLRDRWLVIRLQSCMRTWLARRDRAARVIQRAARNWLGYADIRIQNRATLKIQTLWRGFCVRKNIQSRRMTLVLKRVQLATASATEEKKLCNRTSSALDFLLRYRQLSQVLEALMHLEVASRLSWICCERMVNTNAILVLYRLMRSCNRSLPHMEIIKYTVNILTNLAKYEKTRPAVYEAESSVATLVDIMQIYREKGPIFNKMCTLLGIIALDNPCKLSVLQDTKLVDRLRSIQTLTARKHKLEETQRVTRARMNASCINATFTVRSPMKKQKIKPDWLLHKDKMNDIVNPLKAINFVLENLGIQTSSK